MVHSFTVYLLNKQGATGATLKNLTITKMATIAKFIETLEANNIPYYVGMRTTRWGSEIWSIGVATNGGDVIHWFRFDYDAEMDARNGFDSILWAFDSANVDFEYRYNCNTATVLKSRLRARQIEDAINSNVWPKSMQKRGQVFATTHRNELGLIANRA